MSDIVPRSVLTKRGVQGVIALAGGVGIFILAALPSVIGIIIGGVITVCGIALSGSKHERGLGILTTVLGAGTVIASLPILRGLGRLVHGLEIGAGIILVGVGAYSLFKFFRGLKSRS